MTCLHMNKIIQLLKLQLCWPIFIIRTMPPRRRGTRAQPADTVNQQRGDPVVNEESEEDLDYNEYDEEEYVEEEAEDTHQGGNPMNKFMKLLWANLNQQPIPPQPHAAQQSAATVFRAFILSNPQSF